jgi:predicted nucleotidyltransferase
VTLAVDTEALARLCIKHRIRRLSLFGSVLKGTARPDSDIDLLVEFEPGATPTLLTLASMEDEFSLLARRKVDLRTPAELSSYFRDQILREAQVQYAAA